MAITGHSGFMAASLSALDRGITGAGVDAAGADTAIAAATDIAAAAMDTAADTRMAAGADMPDVLPMAV